MNVKKRILTGILGFYLALALLIAQALIAVYGYFLNEKTFTKRLCSDASVDAVHGYLVYESEFVADSCGLPYSVFADAFPKEKIRSDLQSGIPADLRMQPVLPDTSALRAHLDKTVREALKEIEQTDDLTDYEANIALFCNQIEDIYHDTICLRVYHYFGVIRQTVGKFVPLVSLIGGFVSAMAVVCLVLLARNASDVLRELSFSFVSSGGLVCALAGYAKLRKMFANLQLSPAFFRSFVRSYLADGMDACLLIGGSTLLIGVGLFVLSRVLVRKIPE